MKGNQPKRKIFGSCRWLCALFWILDQTYDYVPISTNHGLSGGQLGRNIPGKLVADIYRRLIWLYLSEGAQTWKIVCLV